MKEKKYVFDIGELWYRFTKLPSVFAVFVISKEFQNKFPEKVEKLIKNLHKAKKDFFKNLHQLKLPSDIKNYLTTLNYDLKNPHIQSLQLMEKFLKR